MGTSSGRTRSQLRWDVTSGRIHAVGHDTFRSGPGPATPLSRSLAVAVATDGVVSGALAAVLHRSDAGAAPVADVTVDRTASAKRPGLRHRLLAPDRIVEVAGFRCTDGLQTLVDLAHRGPDDGWEQALESFLRRGLVTTKALEDELPHLGRMRMKGTARIRRILLMRPVGAPPTESLLETLMVQIARLVPGLGPPQRQVEVFDRWGDFVARVDLAWPELGIFIELDGQQHAGQPVYDASRETAVVAATGGSAVEAAGGERGGLGRVELGLDDVEAAVPEAGVGEVAADDAAELLGRPSSRRRRAGGGSGARSPSPAPRTGGTPTGRAAGRRRRRRRSRACR